MDIFATPLYRYSLKIPPPINIDMANMLLQMRDTTPDSPQARSNAGGWRSDYLHLRKDLSLQYIVEKSNNSFSHLIRDKLGSDANLKWTTNSWAIINENGDYNLPHSHANSDWSSVYYVDSGDTPKESEDKSCQYSGDLMFIDPRGAIVENSRQAVNHTPEYIKMFGTTTISITPQTSMIVFFPSWLMHMVLSYKGSRPRISMATNYTLI